MIDLSRQTLLVIAPHPDDEVIGCGGLIKKIKNAGGRVYVQFLTNGDTRDFSEAGSSSILERRKEIETVAKYLALDGYDIAFEDNDHHLRLDVHGQAAVMSYIERDSKLSIEVIKPTIVTFPAFNSYNQDHRLAAAATHAALRPSHAGRHFTPLALMYEMPAERWQLQSAPEVNFFVPLTKKELAGKTEGMKLYESQMRPFPNPRTPEVLEAFAKLRGAHCGSAYAEAYVAYRMTV